MPPTAKRGAHRATLGCLKLPENASVWQELANLDEAGSLYGNIIYDKAPIVMRQLERVLGPLSDVVSGSTRHHGATSVTR